MLSPTHFHCKCAVSIAAPGEQAFESWPGSQITIYLTVPVGKTLGGTREPNEKSLWPPAL